MITIKFGMVFVITLTNNEYNIRRSETARINLNVFECSAQFFDLTLSNILSVNGEEQPVDGQILSTTSIILFSKVRLNLVDCIELPGFDDMMNVFNTSKDT